MTDPDTSWARWHKLYPKISSVREELWLVIARHPEGLTTYQIAELIGRDRASFSSTLTQMRRIGMLKWGPELRDGQHVWIAVDPGERREEA